MVTKGEKEPDKIWVLTLTYLPVILLTMVFCNPKWGGTTNLLGMHRYVFCSPFIFVFFYHLVNQPVVYKLKHYAVVFAVSNIVWATMGAFSDLQNLLFYNFNTLLVFAYMYYANNKTSWASLAISAMNLFFQIILFQQFLSGVFTE